MVRSFPQLSQALRRGIAWSAAASLGVQSAAVATVVVADALRRRRTPPPRFPRTEPITVPVADSEVTTYTYGTDLYADMLSAIEGAHHAVYFETFIWKDDHWGQVVKDALVAAARRGVQVHVVYDGFANLVVPSAFFRFPDLPTLHVLRFPVVRPGMLTMNVRNTGRDHRKLLVVDGQVGFVGGFNLGSRYESTWRDTHLRVRGPSVWELENAFVDFWNDFRRRHHPEIPDAGAKAWDARVRAARNAPNRLLFPVRGLYLDAIERATSHVFITQGYFIPDQEILTSLVAAARRGVDVRVVMPEASNHVVADWVARSYWTDLLEAGVRIFLFQHAMVHAKTATVDGRWTTVGSANIDRLSLLGNYEINLELHDADLAQAMERIFDADLRNSRELTLEDWQHRGTLARVGERVLRPLGPLL